MQEQTTQFKMGKTSGQLTEEETQMANKHMKR